jgi:hypothetical protein
MQMIAGILIALALAGTALAGFGAYCIRMPGTPHAGSLPPADAALESLRDRLRGHVSVLAGEIGERNRDRREQLDRTAEYIERQLGAMGHLAADEVFGEGQFRNLVVDFYGRELREEILVVGAHYDTTWLTPGADDNASGVAGLLEMARALKDRPLRRSVRLIAFANEEEPFFGGEDMGSMVAAKRSRDRGENVIGMFSLEMIGFYSDQWRSQYYPRPVRRFYPRVGNFIGFVANLRSRGLLHDAIDEFRAATPFPSEGLAAPEWLVPDIRRSDNYAYWLHGFPAVMVTDTSNFRNFNYHHAGDRPETLDYERMARVVAGLTEMVVALANR